MKPCQWTKLILVVIALMGSFIARPAMALTLEEFTQLIDEQGVERAAVNALAEGMNVENIIQAALTVDGMNPRQVLTTLCQKGVNARDITQAAIQNDISALIISAASEECQNEETDTQAYTQNRERTRNVVPARVRQRTGPGEPHVSPSTFQ